MPEFAIFDLKIGFLMKNCIYSTPGMYGKPPKIRLFHGFSKAGFGHASLFLKKPCKKFQHRARKAAQGFPCTAQGTSIQGWHREMVAQGFRQGRARDFLWYSHDVKKQRPSRKDFIEARKGFSWCAGTGIRRARSYSRRARMCD